MRVRLLHLFLILTLQIFAVSLVSSQSAPINLTFQRNDPNSYIFKNGQTFAATFNGSVTSSSFSKSAFKAQITITGTPYSQTFNFWDIAGFQPITVKITSLEGADAGQVVLQCDAANCSGDPYYIGDYTLQPVGGTTTVSPYFTSSGLFYFELPYSSIPVVSGFGFNGKFDVYTCTFSGVGILNGSHEVGPRPTNLALTLKGSASYVLNWKNPNANTKDTVVERKIGIGIFRKIATVSATTTTYTDATLRAGTTYTYRVCDELPGGVTEPSDPSSGTTPTGNTGTPKISVSQSLIDFGLPMINENAQRRLVIRNVGDAGLVGSTEFTAAPWNTNNGGGVFVLEPGQSRTVYVDFNSPTANTFDHDLLITSNDPAQPATKVALHSEMLTKVTIWCNAFIPQTLIANNIYGRTYPVPNDTAGNTMVKGPFNPLNFTAYGVLDVGYFTDQRSFSGNIDASSRMHAPVEIDLTDPTGPRMFQLLPKCWSSTAVDFNTGALEQTATAPADQVIYTQTALGQNTISFDFDGQVKNPCVPFVFGINISPPIHVMMHFALDRLNHNLLFSGQVTQFPAIEIYYALNDRTQSTVLLQKPPVAEKSPYDLIFGPTELIPIRVLTNFVAEGL